ncbi:oligosaccharide flippase family protein [Shouchella clausii]|uniref:oligosaccharide flippase family protein n=1 Tax=Shouchella clausii TaxID=79880 RepID=UPI000799DFD9|nr:oligosaccharide flippase family protein [Shouchella clausii]KKI85097.1 hypothetical protein WZ76_16710 [Shouchella clausii]
MVNKRLFKNIFSLIVLQGSNYIFPLLTFPYLVRVLGVGNYGILMLCTSIMIFINVIIDYGFNITATKYISINKQDHNKVNQKFIDVLSIKIVFTLIAGCIIFFLLTILPLDETMRICIGISYLILLGNTLFPIWLFQGLEKMGVITYVNIIARFLVTVFVFSLVNSIEDLYVAVFLQTLYYVVPGFLALYFIKFKLKYEIKLSFSPIRIQQELKEGFYVFLTTLWINFYNNGPLLLVGMISGNLSAGNYGIGQRIQSAFFGLSQPFTQALYPFICNVYEKDKKHYNRIIKIIMTSFLISSLLIVIILNSLLDYIVLLVVGEFNHNIGKLVGLFSYIIFLGILNTILSRILYSMNKQKVLNKVYMIGGLIFLSLSYPFTFFGDEFGMAFLVIVVECTILISNLSITFKALKKLNTD